MEKEGRRREFDVIKAFAIFLVLLGHTIQYLFESDPKGDVLYGLIYSFHMPLFMMVAGFFSSRSLEMPFKSFITNKVAHLLVPCVAMGLTVWLLWSLLFFVARGAPPSLPDLVDGIVNNYWFLKSLFFCYLLAWFGCHSGLNSYLWLLLSLLMSYFCPLYNINLMYPAFIGGFLIRSHPRFLATIQQYSLISTIVFLVFSFFLNSYIWEHSLFRIILGLWGGASLLGLFSRYYKKQEGSFQLYIEKIGQQTLGIYILQGVILESILPLFLHIDSMNRFFFDFIVAPIISLSVLLLCLALMCVIRKSQLTSVLFFGEGKSHDVTL